MNFTIGGGRQWKLGDIVTWPVDLLKTEVCNSYVAICPQIFRHSWEIWKISCVKVEGCRSMASASIPLTDFVKSSKFCGNPSVPWARSRQRKLAPTLWLKLGNVICSSYTIRTIWRKGLASNARWDKYLSFVSCFSQLFLDIYMNYHVQQDRKHTQQSTLKAVSGKNLTTFFGQSSELSLCSTQTTCRTARRCFSRSSAAAAVAQVFVSPCCLSCSDGSVAVTGHLLCCTFLSWRLSLSRPPTGLCHVAPTFVQDSLHVTKKPTGWPLFNHCLCRTDQEGTSIGRENGKWLSFTPRFPCSGWSHLHLCLVHFKYGLFRCSTLNGSWQGQGLVSQAPNLPTAELLWLGPPALCTAAASTTTACTWSSGSMSATHYLAPSCWAREHKVLKSPGNIHGSQVGELVFL